MELMVVIVLIGITAAAIVPEMRGSYDDAVLRSSSRQLISAFTLAYSRAVALNQTHRVHLNQSNGHYQVEKSGQGTQFVPADDISGTKGTIDQRITVQIEPAGPALSARPEAGQAPGSAPGLPPPPSDAVAFYADGTADPVQVILQDRAGFRLALQVNPVTARVKVMELDRR